MILFKTIINQREKRKMNNGQVFHRIKKAFLLSFVILASNGITNAQSDSVVLIKANVPTISDAFKINDNPRITDTVIGKLNLTYQISPKLYPTTFAVDPIKPAKMSGEPLVKLYKTFIKAGFGSKTTPLAEMYFNNLRSTSGSIGVYFNHLSSSGKIKDYGFPGFSDNKVGIYARRFYKEHTFSADIDYNRNVVHYYGFKKSDYASDTNFTNLSKKDTIKQRFAKVGGRFSFFSTYRDSSKLNHLFALQYYHLSDLYKATENFINFTASADEKVKFLGRSVKNQNLGLIAIVNDYDDINKSDRGNAAVLQFIPHLSAKGDVVKFNIGFNTSISTGKSSIAYLYPDVNVDFNLYNNIFILYGGITGGLNRNNLIDLADENPFINTSLPLGFTNTKYKGFGGITGSLSSDFSFNASVYDENVENLPLFVTDTSTLLQNKFTVVYDNVKIFNSHIELTFQKTDKIKASLVANFYQYNTSKEQKAWHKPASDVTFSFDYNLKDKIILKAAIFDRGISYARSFSQDTLHTLQAVKLKSIIDFNLGLEYRYSKILSAFINFNNIGAAKYKQWYNYPGYGFTVLGGLTYSF
jgi:hypothetical protein